MESNSHNPIQVIEFDTHGVESFQRLATPLQCLLTACLYDTIRLYSNCVEGMMPAENALARNPNVRDEELKAAIDYLCAKIRRAAHKGQPAPFNAYRSKFIFEKALNIRAGQSEWASAGSEKRNFVEQPRLQSQILPWHFDGNSVD